MTGTFVGVFGNVDKHFESLGIFVGITKSFLEPRNSRGNMCSLMILNRKFTESKEQQNQPKCAG